MFVESRQNPIQQNNGVVSEDTWHWIWRDISIMVFSGSEWSLPELNLHSVTFIFQKLIHQEHLRKHQWLQSSAGSSLELSVIKN